MSRILPDKCSRSLVLLSLLVLFVLISGCISVKQEPIMHTQLNKEDNSKKELPTIGSQINQSKIQIWQVPAASAKINQGSLSDIANGNNQFALDLLSQIGDGQQKNIFFSPWSIYSALAVANEGARGKTAKEMQQILNLPENDSLRRQNFALAYDKFNPKGAGYALSTANALWVENDYPLLSNYSNDIARNFNGTAKNVDFKGAAEDTRKMINSWVAERTNDKIQEILSPGDISPLTLFIITNAVYFNGNWAHPFDKKLTQIENFTTGEGKIIEIPMMNNDGYEFHSNYWETENLQALEIPYKDERISMIILLPKKDNISSFERTLSLERLAEVRNSLETDLVAISMPKFTFSTKYSLVDCLKGMGLTIPFTSEADFSETNGKKNLFINEIQHQAFVNVNEVGTEASAATVMRLKGGDLRVQHAFKADHPFIFIIQDRETGNILFLGRVSDPSKTI